MPWGLEALPGHWRLALDHLQLLPETAISFDTNRLSCLRADSGRRSPPILPLKREGWGTRSGVEPSSMRESVPPAKLRAGSKQTKLEAGHSAEIFEVPCTADPFGKVRAGSSAARPPAARDAAEKKRRGRSAQDDNLHKELRSARLKSCPDTKRT